MTEADKKEGSSDLWSVIREKLHQKGVDLDVACCPEGGSPLKVVCVASNLQESVDEMGQTPRDQVIMVRLDEDTTRRLDAWVETGAVKSRSEAAALFIREGLAVRARELEELEDALQGVDEAKERLRDKARKVLGTEDEAT
jgi:Arc/MetJ-type ribon-helix-helix transcriptional regulator